MYRLKVNLNIILNKYVRETKFHAWNFPLVASDFEFLDVQPILAFSKNTQQLVEFVGLKECKILVLLCRNQQKINSISCMMFTKTKKGQLIF